VERRLSKEKYRRQIHGTFLPRERRSEKKRPAPPASAMPGDMDWRGEVIASTFPGAVVKKEPVRQGKVSSSKKTASERRPRGRKAPVEAGNRRNPRPARHLLD